MATYMYNGLAIAERESFWMCYEYKLNIAVAF